MQTAITITWHGHACFCAEFDNYRIVLDPYAHGSVPGHANLSLSAHQVLCSHGHGDHNFAQAVDLLPAKPSPWQVTPLASFHDDVEGAKRGPNTIHILQAGGFKIVHLGDQGCALTVEQANALQGLDALLIPVGGFYTIDAAQAQAIVQQLQPRVVIPMHYRTDAFGLPVIGRLEDFLVLRQDTKVYPGNTITITKDTANQTAVLQYQG